MGLLHTYDVEVLWTGAGATGTTAYTSYSRDHEVRVAGKSVLLGSADPQFRGDPTRHHPEDLLVAALSQCHMLWFLHLASAAGVTVTGYRDRATGTMRVAAAGHGAFTTVVLRPAVTVRLSGADAEGGAAQATPELTSRLAGVHERAHEHCFVARSVNFPVVTEPVPIVIEAGPRTSPPPP